MSKSLVRPFKCSACERPFTRQENLKRHVQTHHPSAVSRSYPCPQCDARFSRSDLRKRHIRNCHPSIEIALPAVPWQSIEDEYCLPSIQDHAMDDNDIFAGVSNLPVKKVTPESQHCKAFFEKFHPTMPMLHEPTFDLDKASESLIKAVTCIGLLYGPAESRLAASRKLFEKCYSSLEEYTKEDCSRFQETSVLQSYILLEFYGVYVCDDTLLSKAQAIHHAVVGAIRELQMTHDGHASRLDSPEEPECIPSLAANNSATLQQRWREFIAEEERKRCIYAVYLLDSQLSIACNLRPQLSALEIKYQLPSADDLWAAPTAESWDKLQKDHFRSFNEHDDRFGTDEVTPSQGSLHGSTQDLLFNRPADPHPPALRLLWYSPFAALVLVTQLQMTARELTHASCLLLRPKLSRNAAMSEDSSHQQQRPLSILTEAQHGQISQALRNIAELAPQPQHHHHPAASSSFTSSSSSNNILSFSSPLSSSATTEGNHPLWHSFWLTWRYTSLTLSHSDALLVSGVVETNLPAAIATAGHLARPRRKRYRDRYEDRDVFRILVDLERALVGIGRGPGSGGTNSGAVGVPELENPFLTLLAFKISLIGWRIVRLTAMTAMADDEQGEGAAAYDGLGGGGGRCDPSRFVLRSIMAAIGEDAGEQRRGDGDGGGGRMMDAEVRYLRWVQEALQKRTVWPVGKWEAAIVQEAAAEAAEYAAMARECGGWL